MLRNFKKLISFVLVLALSVVISLPAFADVNHNSVKDSGVKDSAIAYISEADAALLANQCVKEQVEIGNHCCWTKSTKISETADLFDFEGNVNAYLFRLTTNGKRTGYVFVNAYAKAPSVEAFGYDCDSMLDAMQKSDGKGLASTGNRIIFGGGMAFLTQDKTTGKYSVIGNKSEKIDGEKSDLIEYYKNRIQKTTDINSQSNLMRLQTNAIRSLGRTIYSKHV